jgi:septal ring factor EnvC (AmiA/AmiB activator)
MTQRLQTIRHELEELRIQSELLHDQLNAVKQMVFDTNKKIAHLAAELADIEAEETI